jgi:pyruvate/2-oxoglutarate/acetoin dehydrogenase E1 component
MKYLEAIRTALGDAMAADPRVFCYGQDIAGSFGGAFKATKGLSERFPERVINAPISEDAIAGLAVGAAMEGARPVVEFQFADFASIAFNQLVNHAATLFWRSGRPCPLVARLPCGGTPGGGPFHCQMPEAWLTHHPGLVVVAPATVADAYWMLRDAIHCPDPVIFCEHKYLYYHLDDPDFTPAADPNRPGLGKAVVRREGLDCTVIAYGAMVQEALSAATSLSRDHGIEAEVLDLRCLRPLDTEAILESVARTGRVVVVSEAYPYAGVPAEVVALICEKGFASLDAPPARLCAMDTPVPFHPDLFAAHHPDAERIAELVRDTVAF